jgi:hypothetical protein
MFQTHRDVFNKLIYVIIINITNKVGNLVIIYRSDNLLLIIILNHTLFAS